MNLRDYKEYLHNRLNSLYGKDEVESFFYLILENFLGIDKISFAINPPYILSSIEEERFKAACDELSKQKPIQYIIGSADFYGYKFMVNSSVLIPRPETEELVNWIIKDHKNISNGIRVLDIGTGSGCIAIAIKKNLPTSIVKAIDVSNKALQVAKINAEKNEADINFDLIDIFKLKTESEFLKERFEIIVSNPPYVRKSEKNLMKKNVLAYEPSIALFVEDNDALIFYKKIAELSRELLMPGGCLYFEINEYLSEELTNLFSDYGFKDIEVKNDIFDKPRMIKCSII